MDDYISREKVIAELYKLSDNMIKAGHHQMALGVNDSIVLVGELMPTDAVKHGRWIGYNAEIGWTRSDGSPVFLCCSVCNGTVLNNGSAHWNYCPNCGADMRGEQNDND